MRAVQALEREGGHVIVLLLLVAVFTAVYLCTEDHSERFLDAALGALLLAMKGSGNGKSEPPPDLQTETKKES